MAIRFEDTKDETPARKTVGGKAPVAEQPAPGPNGSDMHDPLPFAKAGKTEKKPCKPLR